MLRKFVQCVNVDERLAMLSDANASQWSADELDAAMNIVGATADENTKEAKVQAMVAALSRNAKEALSDEFVKRGRIATDDIQDGYVEAFKESEEKIRFVCATAMAQNIASRAM